MEEKAKWSPGCVQKSIIVEFLFSEEYNWLVNEEWVRPLKVETFVTASYQNMWIQSSIQTLEIPERNIIYLHRAAIRIQEDTKQNEKERRNP